MTFLRRLQEEREGEIQQSDSGKQMPLLNDKMPTLVKSQKLSMLVVGREEGQGRAEWFG